jgi:hypothetical protein
LLYAEVKNDDINKLHAHQIMKQIKEQSCLLAVNHAAQTHLDKMLWMCV